jgi:hypothetical protein
LAAQRAELHTPEGLLVLTWPDHADTPMTATLSGQQVPNERAYALVRVMLPRALALVTDAARELDCGG